MRRRMGQMAIVMLLALVYAAAESDWPAVVPDADRQRANPYAGQPDASAAGSRLFADHCSKCHGADALGRGKKPSLRRTSTADKSGTGTDSGSDDGRPTLKRRDDTN